MQNPVSNIPETLRVARLNAGLSMAEVAQGICSESYLSLIEAGKRVPSKKIRDQLLARLKVPGESLMRELLSLDFRVAEMALKIGDLASAEKALIAIEVPEERKYIEALKSELKGDLGFALILLKELNARPGADLIRTKIALALTRVSRDVGFTEQAIACGEEELARDRDEISDESESSLLELRAVLSSCYLVKGNIPRALAIANDMNVPTGDSWEKVVSLWAKASAMEANGDFAGALDVSNVAVEVCKRIDRPIAEARLKLTALECRIELEETSGETLLELQHLVAFFESKNLNFDVAESLLIEARAHFLVSNYEGAEGALDTALTKIGRESSELKVRIQIALSECCVANKSLTKARRFLELAHNELDSYFSESPTMAASWRQVGQIYSQLGDVAQGYECLLKATEVLGLKNKVIPPVNQRS